VFKPKQDTSHDCVEQDIELHNF